MKLLTKTYHSCHILCIDTHTGFVVPYGAEHERKFCWGPFDLKVPQSPAASPKVATPDGHIIHT